MRKFREFLPLHKIHVTDSVCIPFPVSLHHVQCQTERVGFVAFTVEGEPVGFDVMEYQILVQMNFSCSEVFQILPKEKYHFPRILAADYFFPNLLTRSIDIRQEQDSVIDEGKQQQNGVMSVLHWPAQLFGLTVSVDVKIA